MLKRVGAVARTGLLAFITLAYHYLARVPRAPEIRPPPRQQARVRLGPVTTNHYVTTRPRPSRSLRLPPALRAPGRLSKGSSLRGPRAQAFKQLKGPLRAQAWVPDAQVARRDAYHIRALKYLLYRPTQCAIRSKPGPGPGVKIGNIYGTVFFTVFFRLRIV